MDQSRRSRRESRLLEGFRQSLSNNRPRRETINFDSENRRMIFGPAQPQKRRSIVDADANNVRRSVDMPPARGSDRDDRIPREDRTPRRNSRRENMDLNQIRGLRQNTINPRKQNRNLLRRDSYAPSYRRPSVGRENPSQEFAEFFSNPHPNSDISGQIFNSDEPSSSIRRTLNPDDVAASRDRQQGSSSMKYPQARHNDYYRPKYRNPMLNDSDNERKHASLTNRMIKVERGYYNQYRPDQERVLSDNKFRGRQEQFREKLEQEEEELYVQERTPNPPPPPPPPVSRWSNQTPSTYNPPRHKVYISNEYDRPRHERLSMLKKEPEREQEQDWELESEFEPEPPPPPPPRPRRPDKWFDPRPEKIEEKEAKKFQGEKIKQEKQVFVWRKERQPDPNP